METFAADLAACYDINIVKYDVKFTHNLSRKIWTRNARMREEFLPMTAVDRDHSVSRRQFLATSGIAATTVAMTAKSYAKVLGANERINVGFLGVGGMGSGHVGACLKLKEQDNLEFLGVADCWKTRADDAAARLGTQGHTDYRKVLDNKDIDYVTIATPEHWHSKMTVDAMDAGKAVYCEKPMTHSIPQAQEVIKKQKETGLPIQVGGQIEYVRRYDTQGPWRKRPSVEGQPQPADLDWDAWLGEAPKIPWNPHHYHEWRN